MNKCSRVFTTHQLMAIMTTMAGVYFSGCQPTTGTPQTVPPDGHFTPATKSSILTTLPGQVTVENPQGHVICYSVNGSVPQLNNGNCSLATQRLPASSIVELNSCGASTVQLAWRDGTTDYTTSASFTMAGEDCVDRTAFDANANQWNDVFQKDSGTPYGWSGGDAAMSLALPFCASCPQDSQYRHFWIFGDTLLSTIDSDGNRVGRRAGPLELIDWRFGNTIGITGHSSTSDIAANNVDFDWGNNEAWMPLLLDPATLPDMDDLRIVMQGYPAQGFENQGEKARVYIDRALVPESISSDVIPIYEYYNAFNTASYYTKQKIENGSLGFAYRRIAFYVHDTQRAGTVPLYRYSTNAYSDFLLDTNPDITESWFGYTDRSLLGYVFPASSSASGTSALTLYFRTNAAGDDFLRVYTTQPQDIAGGVLMWPGRAVVLGNDLVHMFAPVTGLSGSSGAVPWRLVERNIVAIVRGVDRPYDQWGKARGEAWIEDATHSKPQQVALPFTNGTTHWGNLIVKDKSFSSNSRVYIYGLRTNGETADRELLVARVTSQTADAFINFANWRFYSNGSWVTSPDDASAIMTGQIASDFTIHQSPTGRYILTQMGSLELAEGNTLTGPGGKITQFFKADSPWGPFEPSASFNLADYANERDVIDSFTYYANSAHDGLSSGGDSGGLLISYVRSCWESTANACTSGDSAADVYVPRFINLPWHLIDN